MAFYRTGIPRRESTLGGTSGTSIINAAKPFDEQRDVEKHSLMSFNRKNVNESFSDRTFNQRKGIIIRRWGEPGEQQFEQALKVQDGFSDIEAGLEEYWTTSAAGTGIDTERPLTDRECCAWLRIKAPNNVESGSTSGISAGNKKGCVYYWSIEGCNPSYWGCGELRAAGTGGSGAGLHQTSQGMVFIAPTIPDAKTINCGRTVDTKIKVAVLTADGKKQLAASVGTAGWSGFGMGPGDELYDLFGPENVCDDTANITTVADPCDEVDECSYVHIDYATLSLTFYESLVLSVGSSHQLTGDHVYMWSLSGDGILTDGDGHIAYGKSVGYRAPGYAENCTNYGGTVTLYCDGAQVDSVYITVRGVFPSPVPRAGTYWWVTPASEVACGHRDCPPGTCYWASASINLIEVDCNGSTGPYTVMGYTGHWCWCSTAELCAEWVNTNWGYPCYQYSDYQYQHGGCCPDSGGVSDC